MIFNIHNDVLVRTVEAVAGTEVAKYLVVCRGASFVHLADSLIFVQVATPRLR